MTCLACPTQTAAGTHGAVGLGELLCLEHLLVALDPTPVRPAVEDLRGRCWAEAVTCPRPAVTRTAHGGWCRLHAPAQPCPSPSAATLARQTPPARNEAEMVDAAALLIGALGAVPLRVIGHAYGGEDGIEVIPARTYARPPSRAESCEVTDARVPRSARLMATKAAPTGWLTRITVAGAGVLLRAQRGSLRVAASWRDGKFVSAWLQVGNAQPTRLGARQAAALLEVS